MLMIIQYNIIQQQTDHFICMSNRFYNIPTFIKLMLIILILSSILITNIHSNQVYYGTMSFPRSNMFGKSKDQNTLYSVGEDLKIYRINYTRSISSSSFNYNYTTAHLKKIRAIAISPSEKYFATGSEDYSIQIVESFKRKQKCYFSAYNQIRVLVFHPKNDQILFTGSVDDSIRKYNLTDCTLITEKAIGASVHSMISNDDGTFLAFGTYQGHVGKIDENLTIFDLSLNAHKLTVLYMFFTYHDYYVSIGDDNVVILWKAGFQISSFGSLSAKKLKTCAIFQQYNLMNTYRAFSCMESDGGTCFTMLVSNSTFARWSNHICAPSSSNWVDFIRLSTDEQVWAYHYGTTIQFQRIYQDPNSLCNAGINHLMASNATRTCRFCGYLLPGCHFCVDGYCTGCGIATYPQGNGCTNCPSWCSDCSSANSCSVCAVGYERNGGANTICKSAISQQGCFQIQWSGNNGNGFGGSNKCMIAGNGYYVTTSKDCQKCEVYVPYCMQCTASTAPLCLTCRTGYFLNTYNKCPSCNNSMPGCLSCFNSTTCLKCTVAFKYNGANLQCSNCLGSCQTCLTFYDQCSTCYRTQNRIISGDKCICKAGYFDNSTTGNYTCPLCSSALTFCYLCNNSTICTQCQQNYFLYDTGTKTQCQTCDKYCQTCNGRSDNCTSCNDQTFFRMLVASTCVCKPGYVSVGGSVPCLPCSKLNIGCTDCANQTYCNSCENGYYLKVNGTTRLCQLCPYYCPSCNISVFGVINCISCPLDTHRTLVNGTCPCDSEYFDDNRTLICQKCADVLSDCLTCQNRTKCTTCAPGMFTDSTRSFCASCNPICLTCGAFYDICATCDPATNRIISNNKCVCQSFTYEKDGKCIPCSDEISNCISCQNPYICTGCKRGYTLQQDLKGCIDCQGSINGCSSCISPKNCTSCKNPFSLIHYRCRCPIDQYTSTSLWGKCKSYGIPGLKSRLGVQIQAHQHQNNSLIVFIRFRAKTLYVLGKKVNESIKLSINGVGCEINFDYIDNNKVKIRTQLNRTFVKPNVTVTFLKDVFYNQDLLTLSDINETVVPARLYLSQNHQVQSYQAMRQVLRYTFYILKWVFFGFSIIGQGHLLFPFVVFIQLMPIFLMLNMSLPPNLSMTLDAMLSFQVKSVIPMMNMKSNFFVIFPPMTYDYYSLYDFILLGKIGDMLLVIFVNVMTKFDEGIVRMFPPGKIRRYLYQSLVRRGYAVMSLCLLAFQPSLLLLSGVYINYDQWQSSQQIFNYCCCLFVFGFYLAYNFNHASNLQGGKLMKNIENQNCFFGINSQEPTAPRTTLFILATDFWMVASIHLVGPMIYFSVSILMLFIRFLMHLKRDFYIGRIQFAIRTFSNIFLIAIYSLMFVFYLGQSKIDLEINIAEMLGIVSSALILLYLFLYIAEKILYTLKLQADFIEQKVVKNEKGQKIVVFDTQGVENINGQVKNEKQMQNQNKMQQLIAATFNPGKTFSSNAFKKKQEKEAKKEGDTIKQESNYPMMEKNQIIFTDESQDKGMVRNLSDKANQFFSNSIANKTATSKFSRVKTANTSKYAQNHLQLRYKAQGILTKKPDVFEED